MTEPTCPYCGTSYRNDQWACALCYDRKEVALSPEARDATGDPSWEDAPPFRLPPPSRVLHEGDHKNAVRVVVTRREARCFVVEGWQRPVWGVPYVSVTAGHVRPGYDAVLRALRG